jgi:peptidoglycan/LPS O-acetylase OafA/YrhL
MTPKLDRSADNEPSKPASLASSRIERLDSIRFIAALWVVFSHGALPDKSSFSNPVGQFIGSFVGHSFDGASAVMMFFVISGLCIHLPYVRADHVSALNFLARRYIRIGIPLAAVLLIMAAAGGSASWRGHEVLWSIYAELIYYTLYPLLFFLARRLGWRVLIACSSAVSATLAIMHPTYVNLQEFGWLTWLWGLPVWLSGCALAEGLRSNQTPHLPANVWWWRFAAWAFGILALVGAWHSKIRIGLPISMLLFAAFAYFWLTKEIENQSRAWQWLERCGQAGYSLYLVHNILIGWILDHFPNATSLARFPLIWIAIGIATYTFYVLVEYPSHVLAKRAGRSFGAPTGRPPFLMRKKVEL